MEQKTDRAAEDEAVAKPYSYRNLDLWRRAQELALGVIKMIETLPANQASRAISRQIVSSAGSVAANIAEGHGRYSVAAYRNHLSIARGSVAETDSWLDLLARAGYVSAEQADELHEKCQVLMGALTRQMRALESKLRANKGSALREDGSRYLADEEMAE